MHSVPSLGAHSVPSVAVANYTLVSALGCVCTQRRRISVCAGAVYVVFSIVRSNMNFVRSFIINRLARCSFAHSYIKQHTYTRVCVQACTSNNTSLVRRVLVCASLPPLSCLLRERCLSARMSTSFPPSIMVCAFGLPYSIGW